MKKAQMLTYMVWLLRVAFMGAVILSIGLLISKYINATIDISQVQANTLNYRMLLENPFMYKDKYTGRAYPLLTTAEKINSLSQESFQQQIEFRYPDAGAKLKLNANDFTKTFYYNQEVYSRLEGLKETFFAPLITHAKSEYPIVLLRKGRQVSAQLTIEVYWQ